MKLNLAGLSEGLNNIQQVDRAALRRDGLTLFGKLIRTKNVEALQGEAPTLGAIDDSKVKLKVGDLGKAVPARFATATSIAGGQSAAGPRGRGRIGESCLLCQQTVWPGKPKPSQPPSAVRRPPLSARSARRTVGPPSNGKTTTAGCSAQPGAVLCTHGPLPTWRNSQSQSRIECRVITMCRRSGREGDARLFAVTAV